MIHVLVPSLVGLAGALLAWRSATAAADRRNWATVMAALLGAAALSVFVFRSVSTAHLFALPGCAWLGLRAWTRARTIRAAGLRILASAMAALTLPLLGGMAVAALLSLALPALRAEEARAAAKLADTNRYRVNCLDAAAVADLNRLPPTTLLTPIDLGAPLVFWTPHRLVATPHHRNKEAMADTIRAFAGDPAEAEALVRRQQARLVVYCRTANDFARYRRARKDGLAAQLHAGTPPAWLEAVPVSSRAGLALWRVKTD
jgi:hypothetical protein